jgi:hypothetical protein
MPGTLEQVEQVAKAVERGEGSLASRTQALRPPAERPDSVEIRSAVAWMKRRHRATRAALAVLLAVVPGGFGTPEPTVSELLGGEAGVLVQARDGAGETLAQLPAPIGFLPPRTKTNKGCGIEASGDVVSSVCAATSGASKGADRCQKRAETRGGVPP